MPPRIAPVEPPYEPEIEELLAKWMPPGSDLEPLKLFRTLAVHPELASRMRPLGAALLGHPTVAPREREIVIHRMCARAGAAYEWGVHAVAFAAPLGLTEAQLRATALGAPDDPVWEDPRDGLLVALADAIHEGPAISDALWVRLAREWEPPQLIELVVLAGWYRLVAGVIEAARVEPEPWAAPLPEA